MDGLHDLSLLLMGGMVFFKVGGLGMGGLLLYTMIVFTGRLCASGSLRMLAFMLACECLLSWLASSLCRSYEAKSLQMKKESSSENSPRIFFGFENFTL